MIAAEKVLAFLLQILAYGGGGAAVAYLLFQHLGKTWMENKFAERLDQIRHQQSMELQRLRVEIDSLLSGTIKLQEIEFSVLPDAWSKLENAHSLVASLVAPMQLYPDLDRMNPVRLEEFLASTEFDDSHKDDIRRSREKTNMYIEIIFWYRLDKVKSTFNELRTFVARNGIFLTPGLKDKFEEIAEHFWFAITSKEIGHEAKDWKMQKEGWEKIKEDTEPLYKAIESNIQARLQSHARKR